METDTPRRKRRGCLGSCLIVLLVFIVVIAGTVGAAYTFGRPYVARKLPEWEAKYPLIGLASGLLNLRSQFVQQGPLVDLTARQSGSNDKSLMPPDIVMYPDPLEETYNIGPSQVTGYQRVRADVWSLEDHFQQTMPARGWEQVSESDAGDSRVLVWSKGKNVCHTEFVALERSSEVWLRCTLVAEEAAEEEGKE